LQQNIFAQESRFGAQVPSLAGLYDTIRGIKKYKKMAIIIIPNWEDTH
jgi:hypothetical protein